MWKAWFGGVGILGENVQFVPADPIQAGAWLNRAAELQSKGYSVVMILDADSYRDSVVKLFGAGNLPVDLRPTIALLESNTSAQVSLGKIFSILTNVNFWGHILQLKIESEMTGLEEMSKESITYSILA